MGARPYRLRSPKEFAYVLAGGQRVQGTLAAIAWRERTGARARLGFTVSRRNCPLAVLRNRARRVAREAFSRHPIVRLGVDVVVSARRKLGRADLLHAWRQELVLLLSRIEKRLTSA